MIKFLNWIKRKLWIFVIIIIFAMFAMILNGCTQYAQRDLLNEVDQVQSKVADVAQAIAKVEYGSDETINLLRVIEAGNVASSPFNPFALPIGAGLTGIIAMLEALRRKEKDGRKYAEHELNNNKNHAAAT